MNEGWARWEEQVINGVYPLRRPVSFSDHSAVFLTEHKARNLPNALLKLVPAIPTLKDAQLAHWSAAATLAHPHLVPILETGRCQLGGLQFLFIVMEYAEVTLAKLLAQRALAPDALRRGMRPILTSLAFLHRKQLVHGSLKPSNILLVNQQLKLASDTVRPTGESAASIAAASAYDPPESRDGSFSAAGDIWSLGVIMAEALTQRLPSCLDRRSGAVSLPTAIPPQFAQLIRQCLSRDPANRPTVGELYLRLNPAQPVLSAQAQSVQAGSAQAGAGAAQAASAQSALARPASAQPASAQSALARPASAEPAWAQSALARPASAEPAWAQSALAQPAWAQPAWAQSAPARPSSAQPAWARPVQTATVTPIRYPVLLPPEPAPTTPVPERFAREEPSSTAPAAPPPPQHLPNAPRLTKRRSFVPIGATALIVLIVLLASLRMFYSQTYPSPTAATAVAAMAPTERNPTAVMPTPADSPTYGEVPAPTEAPAPAEASMPAKAAAPVEVPTPAEAGAAAAPPAEVRALSPAPGFAKSEAVIAADPILHEEAPDVTPTALATIHGNIRIAVKVAVDQSGKVARATLATRSPSRYFSRLATETARRWKFAAADEQGTRKWLLWFEFTRNGASAHAASRGPSPGRIAPPTDAS